MTRKAIIAVAFGLFAGLPGVVGAQFADFESGTSGFGYDCATDNFGTLVDNGYSGFNWSNFYTAGGEIATQTYGGPGYANGVVSGSCIALNGFGAASEITSVAPFTFNGGWFTAAFNPALSMSITGFSGATQLFQSFLLLDTDTPQNLLVEWAGLDRVVFASGDGQPGSQFVFDNFRFNGAVDPGSTVPEPATMTLLATGLAGMAAARRRRKA
jgi:hypothetical protein